QDGLRSHVCPGSRRPSLARGRSEAWTQHGAGRHHAGREITPQRHHQLARQRHDGDAAHPSLHVANALTEPAAEIAARLMPQPQPGELDRKLARTPVAGLADALLAAALAAVVRRARKPEIAADLTAIVERAIECLVDQPLPADRTDALELDELPYLGLGRAGLSGEQGGLVGHVERVQLLGDKAQSLVFAHDLLLEPRRQHPTVARAHLIDAREEARLERLGLAHPLAVQQSLDAIAVRDTLLQQALPRARAPLAILILHRWHMDHAADPRLAPQIGKERAHQLLQIDPIGLRAPRTTAHLDARRIDLIADHPLVSQPTVQPMPVETGLVA